MKNNPILDKNLSFISKYNSKLTEKILKIDSLTKDISFVNTVLGEPNLLYNGEYLHNNYGAEAEAKEIFEKIKTTEFSMNVIYGFGLGYLFQEFAINSKGLVFVFEPDIEILATTLEVVDFSEELSKKNVFIFNDFDELKKCYLENFIFKSDTSINFLPSYKKIFEKDLLEFAQRLNLVMGSAIIDNNYIKNKLIPAVKSVCNNIDCLVKEPTLGVFKDIYKDKTALVISAGPSLDKNLETIKKYRDKVVIFSVGQALRTLLHNDITPDFVGLVETSSQMSQLENLDTSNINLILEPLTYNGLHKSKFKNIISYPSKTSIPNNIWTKIANIDNSKYISSGTVSYMMLYSAYLLGFKYLILVGQDLAFLDGKCYTKDTQHKGLTYEYDSKTGSAKVKVENVKEFSDSLIGKNVKIDENRKIEIAQRRIEAINKNLCNVQGIKGNQLLTTYDYASFISQFEDFAKEHKNDLNLFNTSLEGAKINGFKDVPLEEILQNKENLEKIDLKSNCDYDLQEIVSKIKIEINSLEKISKTLNTANSLIHNYDKEFNNRKIVNDTCIKNFKQLMMIYIDFTNTFSKTNDIFRMLQKPYQQELDYSLKINNQPTSASINKVYQNLKVYMTSLQKNINNVKEILETKVKNINEMSNPKS